MKLAQHKILDIGLGVLLVLFIFFSFIPFAHAKEKTGNLTVHSFGINKEPLYSDFEVYKDSNWITTEYYPKSLNLPEGEYTVKVMEADEIIFDKVKIVAGKETEVSAEFGKLTVYSYGFEVWQNEKRLTTEYNPKSIYLPEGDYTVKVQEVNAEDNVTIVKKRKSKVSAEPGKFIHLPPEYEERIILASDDNANLVVALAAANSIGSGVVITPKGKYEEGVIKTIKDLNSSEVWIVGDEDISEQYIEKLREADVKFQILGGPTKELTSLIVFEKLKWESDTLQGLISSVEYPLLVPGKLPIYISDIEDVKLYLSDHYNKVTIADQKPSLWEKIRAVTLKGFGKDTTDGLRSKQIAEIATGYDGIPATKEMVKETDAILKEAKKISKKEGYFAAIKTSKAVNDHAEKIERQIKKELDREIGAYLEDLSRDISDIAGNEDIKKITEEIFNKKREEHPNLFKLPKEEVGKIYNDIGVEILDREGYAPAVFALIEAAKADNNNPIYLSNLATILTLLGKPQDAARLLSYAKQRGPENPYIISNLGVLHSTLGMHKEAADDLRRASRIAKDNTDYLYALGEEYLKLGDNEKATVAFEKINSINPSHKKASQAFRRTAELLPYCAKPPAIVSLVSGLEYIMWALECADYEYQETQKHEGSFDELQSEKEDGQKITDELKKELKEEKPYISASSGGKKVEWVDTDGDSQLDTEYTYEDKNKDGEFTEEEKVSDRKLKEKPRKELEKRERAIDMKLEKLENEMKEQVEASQLAAELNVEDEVWEDAEKLFRQVKKSQNVKLDTQLKMAVYSIEKKAEDQIKQELRDSGFMDEMLLELFGEEGLKEFYGAVGESQVLKTAEGRIASEVKKNIVKEAQKQLYENPDILDLIEERDAWRGLSLLPLPFGAKIQTGIQTIVKQGIDYGKIRKDEEFTRDLKDSIWEQGIKEEIMKGKAKFKSASESKSLQDIIEATEHFARAEEIRLQSLESEFKGTEEYESARTSLNDLKKTATEVKIIGTIEAWRAEEKNLPETVEELKKIANFAGNVGTVTKLTDKFFTAYSLGEKLSEGETPTTKEVTKVYTSLFGNVAAKHDPGFGTAITLGFNPLYAGVDAQINQINTALDSISYAIETGDTTELDQLAQRMEREGLVFPQVVANRFDQAIEDTPIVGWIYKGIKWISGR